MFFTAAPGTRSPATDDTSKDASKVVAWFLYDAQLVTVIQRLAKVNASTLKWYSSKL